MRHSVPGGDHTMTGRTNRCGKFLAGVLLFAGLSGTRTAWAGDIDIKTTTSNGSTSIAFQNVAGSTLAVITSSGNVGIGTTNPIRPLDVVGKMKSTMWNVTQVYNNVPSLPQNSGTFTSNGGTLLILASGSGLNGG